MDSCVANSRFCTSLLMAVWTCNSCSYHRSRSIIFFMSVHWKLYGIFNSSYCRLASLSLPTSPSTITVKPIPLSRHEATHAHDLILPLPCFTYLKHFSRNPERKHLDEIELCANNIIASLPFLRKFSCDEKNNSCIFIWTTLKERKRVN